jgi:phosphate/sulfate permease
MASEPFGETAALAFGARRQNAAKVVGAECRFEASSLPLLARRALGESFRVSFWVLIPCQSAMALGTLTGGWRIVYTAEAVLRVQQ